MSAGVIFVRDVARVHALLIGDRDRNDMPIYHRAVMLERRRDAARKRYRRARRS